jgi:hypothetical protein
MVAVVPQRSKRFCQERLSQEKKTPGCERIETRRHSRAIAWGQFWQPNRVAYRGNWVIKPASGQKVSPQEKKFPSRWKNRAAICRKVFIGLNLRILAKEQLQVASAFGLGQAEFFR